MRKGLFKEFLDKNWNRRGLDYLLKKLRETGTAERTIGSGRRRSSRTTQNIDAVEDLRRETPDFISPDLWPLNSLDLNPVDYAIWAVMQRRVYQTKIHTIDELNQRLIEVWCGLEQSTVVMAVDHGCDLHYRTVLIGGLSSCSFNVTFVQDIATMPGGIHI